MSERSAHRPLLALILLVPAPTIGVGLAMSFAPTAGTWIGQLAYGAAKLWILAMPLCWLLFVERAALSWSPPRLGGFGAGAAIGVAVSLAILGTYALLGDRLIDPATVREAAERSGIASPGRYIALAIYIATVNAVLEEYVWRWFVFRQCERILPAMRGLVAVALSALLFTVHHVFALGAQLEGIAIVLGSLGVFAGGAIWSWCYLRYRSIWPGYVSHAIVDVAVFAIGWHLIFG